MIRPPAQPLNIVVLGLRRLAYEGIRTISDSGVRICAVFTTAHDLTDDVPVEAFRELADRIGAQFFATDQLDLATYEPLFRKLSPDLIVTLGWRRLIRPELLATSRLGGVNVHMAPLPRYRGFAPQNWAIVLGERQSGVTLHHMADAFDTGDIIDQRLYEIGPEETIADLEHKGLGAALGMLRERLPEIAVGSAPRRPQDETAALYCFPRIPSDGEIDWRRSAVEIHRLVRAVTHPYPGAYTFESGRRLFVWAARCSVDGRQIVAVPGSIVSRRRSGSVTVATGDGVIDLLRVQPDGGAEVFAGDHLRSARARLGIKA